jgi:DNA topoisomerase-1
MIATFYKGFHPLVEKSEKVSREEASQARLLGKDPKTGRPIHARFGRYGAMLQKGEASDTEKPDFAPMPEGQTIETVKLDQALEMFKLPRTVGTTADDRQITANIGRFGPYIQVDKTFVSIKPLDPLKITEDQARKLYKQKLEKEAKKHIKTFSGGLQVLNGPYGPYVTNGKINAKVPKDKKAEKLSEKEAADLIKNAPARTRRK